LPAESGHIDEDRYDVLPAESGHIDEDRYDVLPNEYEPSEIADTIQMNRFGRIRTTDMDRSKRIWTLPPCTCVYLYLPTQNI
jgi:hypothetical protein